MKRFVLVVLVLFLGACATAPQPETSLPAVVVKPTTPADKESARKALFDIVNKSSCQKFGYGGKPGDKGYQGQAPAGYLKGIALTYVRTVCSKESVVYKIGSQPIGSASVDALAHYGLSPKSEGERLSTTAALMIGSNARESSWRPCVGRDVAAKESDVKGCLCGTYNGIKYTGSGSTCECSLSQTSFNSVPPSGPLRDVYDGFRKDQSTCFRSEYYGKTTCSEANWKNHGCDPKAVEYQKLSKECPALSVESAFIMFRTKRTHYGPINKKAAEVVPACISMFEQIRTAVEKDPSICGAI